MKVKRNDIATMVNVLNSLNGETTNKPKFSYAIIKNFKVLQTELDLIQEARPTIVDEVETKRNEMLLDLAKKDEEGKPVWREENKLFEFTIPDEEVNKKIKDLYDAHPTLLQEIEDFNNLLEEEVDLELLTVGLDLLPELSLQQMVGIEFMVID